MPENRGGIEVSGSFSKLFLKMSAVIFIGFLAIVATPGKALADSGDEGDERPQIPEQYFDYLYRVGSPEAIGDSDLIRYLQNFPYEETMTALLTRLETEIGRHQDPATRPRFDARIIDVCLQSIGGVGNQTHVKKFLRLVEKIRVQFSPPLGTTKESSDPTKYLLSNANAVAAQLESRNETLHAAGKVIGENHSPEDVEALSDALQSHETVSFGGMEVPILGTARTQSVENLLKDVLPTLPPGSFDIRRIEEFESFLHSRIFGQPEVIRAFVASRLRDMVKGENRSEPEVFWFDGESGTGKDTAVNALADALNGSKRGSGRPHLFRIDPVRSTADLWLYQGSIPGHVNAELQSRLIHFAVDHSGGRYQIQTRVSGDKTQEFVQRNPEWKADKRTRKSKSESRAVVFIDELDQWPMQMKEDMLSAFLETGYLKINNPNGGLSFIYFKPNVVMASNVLVSALSAKRANGTAVGDSLPYEQRMERWRPLSKDYRLIRRRLAAGNQQVKKGADERTKGTPDKIMNRISNRNIIVMRPLNSEDLQRVVQERLENMASEIAASPSGFGNIEISWDAGLVRWVQEFEFDPQENARPMRHKVVGLIETSIYDAIRAKLITASDQPRKMELSIVRNRDKTFSLKAKGDLNFEFPIEDTNYLADDEPLSDADIAKLRQLEEKINSRVFGVEHISAKIARAVMVGANGRKKHLTVKTAKYPALTMIFDGITGVAKTETAKAIAEAVFDDSGAFLSMDFSSVKTIEDIRTRILGTRHGDGTYTKSDWMEAHDKHQGQLVVLLDELAKVPGATDFLYEITREPVMTGFSDGEPRIMTNTIIIATGNATAPFYDKIPRSLPKSLQMVAQQQVYKAILQNPQGLMKFMDTYYSQPFRARVGADNIFIFSPLSFKSRRQLVQLKLGQMIDGLKDPVGRRWWDVKFKSDAEYLKAVELIETDGFDIWTQGASITQYVGSTMRNAIEATLITEFAPTGAAVIVSFESETKGDRVKGIRGEATFKMEIPSEKRTLFFKVPKQLEELDAENPRERQMMTTYHESGHEIVREGLMGDVYETDEVKNTFGISPDDATLYAGWVKWRRKVNFEMTATAALFEVAIMTGGYVAQRLVTRGRRDDAGKSDDMAKASALIYNAILVDGLDPEWDTSSVPKGMSVEQQVTTFSSDAHKNKLERLKLKWLRQAESLAEAVLLANFKSHFIPFSIRLAETAYMSRDDIRAFYKEHGKPVNHRGKADIFTRLRYFSLPALESALSPLIYPGEKNHRDARFLASMPDVKTLKIKMFDDVVAEERVGQLSQVAFPEQRPVLSVAKQIELYGRAEHADPVPLVTTPQNPLPVERPRVRVPTILPFDGGVHGTIDCDVFDKKGA